MGVSCVEKIKRQRERNNSLDENIEIIKRSFCQAKHLAHAYIDHEGNCKALEGGP